MLEPREERPFKPRTRASYNGDTTADTVKDTPSSRVHARVATKILLDGGEREDPSSRVHARVATPIIIDVFKQQILQAAYTRELQRLFAL